MRKNNTFPGFYVEPGCTHEWHWLRGSKPTALHCAKCFTVHITETTMTERPDPPQRHLVFRIIEETLGAVLIGCVCYLIYWFIHSWTA